MTSRERIKKILNFKIPDRVGIADDFTDGAVKKWKENGDILQNAVLQDFFDFDIRLFGFDQNFSLDSKNIVSLERINMPSIGEGLRESYEKANSDNRFLVISCMEPFEHISKTIGREKTLTMMAEEANKVLNLFGESLEFTLKVCQLLFDKEYHFDGAWLWGDLGYKKSPLLSTDYYNTFLFDLHNEFCDFFAKKDMPVIFHSDGNIRELMPHLIEAGIRAIEPLESDVGMDLIRLKKEFGKEVVLFGGIDEAAFLDLSKAEKEIASKFKFLMKDGGYIYHADSPVPENVEFKKYKNVIELVKKYGAY